MDGAFFAFNRGDNFVKKEYDLVMNFSWLGTLEIVSLILVATMGYVFSLFWHLATQHNPQLAKKKVYAISPSPAQIRSEAISSLFTPIHALLMLAFGALG